MDWIKVKVKHAEYDFVGAPDHVFRAWIMAMIFTAALDKIPTPEQLELKLGENNYRDLCKHLKNTGTSVGNVLKKVMEDVNTVYRKRKHSSEYMSEYRSKTLHKVLRGDNVNAKIREDKIREDRTVFKGLKHLAKKNPDMKKALLKLGMKI